MRRHWWAALAAGLSFLGCGTDEERELVEEADPIAYVGHGALFDHEGTQLVPDAAFAQRVQAQYRRTLEAQVDPAVAARSRAFASAQADLDADERAYLDAMLVRHLAAASTDPSALSIRGKSITLQRTQGRDAHAAIDARLQAAGLAVTASDVKPLVAASYEADCLSAGVPVPPAWGTAGWTYNGNLHVPFTLPGLTASIYYWSSESPRGTCIALPRWGNSGPISFLGVICHGIDTSKACFWDNAQVPWGTVVPMSQFVKGSDPAIINGGNCTTCHAGENPFVIHPNTALDLSSVVPASRWFAKNWYDPLIASNLAQNPGPTNAIAGKPVASGQGSCASCHTNGQRLPELLGNTGYCGSVFRKAVGITGNAPTMPPSNPSGLDYSPHINALEARCSSTFAFKCAEENAKICAQAGGYCEFAMNGSGAQHDLCRWPTATTETACKSTAGIWTAKNSGFALGWPTAVPLGAAGACITQMRNIGGGRAFEAVCSTANRDLCRRRGGLCEAATNTGGGTHQLCRWPNHDTQAKCASTAGIWTAKGSGFDLGWPSALRNDELVGACITQMANIGGTPN